MGRFAESGELFCRGGKADSLWRWIAAAFSAAVFVCRGRRSFDSA
ncbi:MAG: hypothetical protein ACLTQI_05360 [Slackia sp.]